MTCSLQINDRFPDATLPDQRGIVTRLSKFTRPGQIDEQLGFRDGYPLIVIFGRGFFCPRDQQQCRQLVQFQDELAVNYCKLVMITADAPIVNAAFRAGLGARWPFLSDEKRALIEQLNILDETEGEYAYRAQPYTFVLRADLTVAKIYNGWWYVGRPTIEELRQDLRAIMATRADYDYEAYTTPAVRQLRIPQQEWLDGAPPLGANGLPVLSGVVRWFDLTSGNGGIARDDGGAEVFFNFTAIPGAGYRTIRPNTRVRFELVEHAHGASARNIQEE
jgi:cold shock CspA family protein/peroxiredoxin